MRQEKIVEYLYAKKQAIAPRALAAKFQISERTLANDIKWLKEIGSNEGFTVERVRSAGYQLKVFDNVRFSDNYDLTLFSKAHYGLKIMGTESKKRRAILYLIRNTIHTPVLTEKYKEFNFVFNEEELRQLLKEQLLENQLKISDIVFENIVQHIRLLSFRILQNNTLNSEELEEHAISDDYDRLTEKLVGYLEETYQLNFSCAEKNYLEEQLRGKFAVLDDPASNQQLRQAIDKSLELVDRRYHTSFRQDQDLANALMMHVAPLLQRLYTGHQLENPIIEDIYTQYANVFLEEAGMQIGDMILPNTKARKSFNQKKIMGKALDDRVACTIMVQVKNQAETKKIEVIGVGTVQEEAGTRGSKVAAAQVDADINIVIDVANGKDTPHAADFPNRIQGNGPGLVLADKTALGNIKLLDYCKEIAEKNQLPWQYDLLGGGGTDAGSVQLFAGKPTLVFCVPVRYCHSWNSIVEISDVEATIDLLSAVIRSLDEGGIELEQF